jgi:outer membrane autotransporter protein
MTFPRCWLGLLRAALALVALLLPSFSWADDLVIDGGTTYTVSGDITYTNEYVGQTSGGTINQSGGTNSVSSLFLGNQSGSNGTYNLSGGVLSSAGQIIGYDGSGIFTQSGGIGATGSLTLGLNAGGSGVYNQNGGANTVAGIIFLGNNQGSGGVYNLNAGSLSAGFEIIGHYGLGAFNQSGGTNTISTNLHLGWYSDSSGAYNLSGGSLGVVQNEFVGYHGKGVFNQSGGSNTLDKNLGSFYVGYWQGSDGTYNLSGGSLSSSFEAIGYRGVGAFNQSGGDNTLDNQSGGLFVGVWNGGNGTYSLSNGSLASAFETMGYHGLAAFNQSGGNNKLTNDLTLGDMWASNGTYNLSGGSLSTSNTTVGNWGNGTFVQTGGTHTVSSILTVAANPGSSGTYNLQGGSLSAGTVKINTGGTLSFTGGSFTSAILNNSGKVYAGPGGTLNVGGSYTQTAVGNFLFGIDSPTSYGRVKVTGTGSLNGMGTPILVGGYTPRGNQVFADIIAATGGISGSFSLADTYITPTLHWQPRWGGNSFDLLVLRDYANPGLNLNSNQQAVGAMLNGLVGSSGDLDQVLNAIDNLPTNAGVQDAFKQISPEKAGSLTTLGFAGSTFQLRHLATRTTNLRFAAGDYAGGARTGLGGLGFNYSRGEGVMLAYNGSDLSQLISGGKALRAPQSRWGLFADGGAAFGGQKSTLNQTGFDFTLGGFTAGADYRVKDALLLGLASGYSHISSGFHGSGGNVQANTLPVNAYAAYLPGPFYAFGSLGYALNFFDLERGLNFGGLSRTAKGSTTGHQFNLYAETGYDLKTSRFILTPSTTLAYSSLWVNSLAESGADALNLKISSQAADSLQTGVGGRLTVPLKVGQVPVMPQGYAFYQHEFANGSRGLNARLSQGGSAFAFQTDAAKRDFAVLGASVTVGLKKNLWAQVDYNAEVGRGNYTAHYVNAGLRLEF